LLLFIQGCMPAGRDTDATNASPAEISSTPSAAQGNTPTPAHPEIEYRIQAGDTLPILALRFGVKEKEILRLDSQKPITGKGLLKPGIMLSIPDRLNVTTPSTWLIPDSEVVYSPSVGDFDAQQYVQETNGYFATFTESIWNAIPQPGGQAVATVAIQNSINPRLLLALLELRCGCVLGDLNAGIDPLYLAGTEEEYDRGFYRQLMWMIEYLNQGYYGWRTGEFTRLEFLDGTKLRINPQQNAGTVALMNLFAQWYTEDEWEELVSENGRFSEIYREMFGDPWQGANKIEPLYDENLVQPEMTLPYLPGHTWSYTGGPHSAWEKHGPEAAIDFNPGGYENSCDPPQEWVVTIADGVVTRLEPGVLLLDLDGDGDESTGWVVLYVHLLTNYDIKVGDSLKQGEIIGFPSCLGGPAESAHIHVARKYNGEWMLAGGAVPMTLDGWVVGDLPGTYLGTLTKDGQTVSSCTCATADTRIKRPRDE
jgi:LasA protease